MKLNCCVCNISEIIINEFNILTSVFVYSGSLTKNAFVDHVLRCVEVTKCIHIQADVDPTPLHCVLVKAVVYPADAYLGAEEVIKW